MSAPTAPRARLAAGLIAGGAALLLLAPQLVFTNAFQLDQARLALYFAILACTWSLLAGVAGQFSFAHVALGGLAGYAGAIWSRDLDGPLAALPWSVLAGTLFAFAVGLAMGALALRLHGAYLALFTIAFAEVARLIIIAEGEFTGGDLSLPTAPLSASATVNYYALLAVLFSVLAAVYGLLRTRAGLYLRALRESPDAAAALGVNVTALRLFAFGYTSLLVGLGASVYFHTAGRMVPASLDLIFMSQVIAFAVIGGLESPLAAAVAAVVLALGLEQLRDLNLGVWRLALFGAILVLTLRLAPNGVLTPLIARLSGRHQARRATVGPRDAADALPAPGPTTGGGDA